MRERLYVWQERPTFFRGLARVHYQLKHFPFGMADISIEQADDRVYFTDATGEKWRVHDVSFGPPYAKPHQYHRFASGAQRATSRVFVSARGARRSYRFGRGETRDLSAETCGRQLARADFLSDATFDARSRSSR